MVLFPMTLSDLKSLSEYCYVFIGIQINTAAAAAADAKYRAASLQQLSFLLLQ